MVDSNLIRTTSKGFGRRDLNRGENSKMVQANSGRRSAEVWRRGAESNRPREERRYLTPSLYLYRVNREECRMTVLNAKLKADSERSETSDPVLLMVGVGKQLWESESGDKFIERLRSEELAP